MTDTQPPTLDLDGIQARHEAATSGTWYLQPKYGPDFVASESAGYEHGIGTLDFGVGDQADADREFVLNAHTDMAALLARVAELEQQLAEAQAATDTNREIATVLFNELIGSRPSAECGAPHPVAADTRCERQPGHDGEHASIANAWPIAQWPVRPRPGP